jgi:hypothetical protein
MAYNPGYISLRSIIERVYRKAGIDKIEWEDALEWTADLMGLIGVPSQYIDRFTNGQGDNPQPICIIDGRGELPYGVINVKSCRRILFDRNGMVTSVAPMIKSSGTFYQYEDTNSLYELNVYPSLIHVTNFELDSDDNLDVKEYIGEALSRVSNTINEPYQYKINGGYIFTNFMTGYVEMAYTSIPLDPEGFPLIPDDYKYIRALEDYLIERIDYKVWRQNPSPQNKSILNDSEQKSAFSIGAAITKGRIPSIDEMESIKNNWLRSISKILEHSNNFNTLNQRERRYNNRY